MSTLLEEVVCNCCGEAFLAYTSDIKDGGGKYCSRKCTNLGRGYQSMILAALPGDMQQIVERTGLTQKHAVEVAGRMLRNGLMHATGLVPNTYGAVTKMHSRFILMYAAGPSADPAVPLNLRAALGYFYNLRIISVMPATKKRIERKSGIDKATILKRVDDMHAAGKCHIKGWDKGKQGAPMAIYGKGPGKDAPCDVVPLTDQQKYRRYMDKIDRTGRREEWRKRNVEQKRNRVIRTVTGDPFINALFGTPAQRKQQSNQQGDIHE